MNSALRPRRVSVAIPMQDSAVDVAALTQAAVAALSKGEAARARDLLEQVIAAKRADTSIWLAMAHACALLGDKAGKIAAIDQALALEPGDLSALIAKADHLTGEGDQRGAVAFYGAALKYAPRFNQLPPHLQAALRRAHEANQRVARELEDFVRASLDGQASEAHMPRRALRAPWMCCSARSAHTCRSPSISIFPSCRRSILRAGRVSLAGRR